ncbi:hypothetical protein I35_1542 [Burkholderia cenocepacia H111]|nr:hypothetical protein I35_1542 [Burkholderia cenocepacia H111]
MPRIGAAGGDDAGTVADAVSGDGCTGAGPDAVWQAASARHSATASGTMADLERIMSALA